VASEVRALAQRSAEAAKEIKALISASNTQVAAGVNLVGETGKALTRIVTQIAEINGVVTDIAASAQEQATGLNEVNTAVNQMDQVTQQNAAMVEESTAASYALAQEAEELTRIMSEFKVGAQSAGVARIGAKRRDPVGAPVHAAQAKVTAFAGSRGGAARAPKEETWTEF
jgi:methyl-accepting chemotaxis protein